MGLEKLLDKKSTKNMASFELLKLLVEKPRSKNEILSELGLNNNEFSLIKNKIKEKGFKLEYNRSRKQYYIGKTQPYEMSPKELEIADKLENLDLTNTEIDVVLKNLKNINPRVYTPQKIKFSENKIKFGYFSDAHMGHLDYRPDVLSHAIENWRKQDVDFIVNSGDTLEGMSGREGHVYELSHLGYSAQKNFFVEQFQPFVDYGFKVYSIEAQNSHSGWYNSKGNQGVNIGEELDRASKAYKFIGYDEQDLVLDNGLRIRLRHPGGGTAYTISYKMQKYIESIGGGDKPNILLQGHFHKHNKMFYRNIWGVDAGCLQNQSPFMKKKGTPAHIGYGIITAYYNKKGVERFIEEFVPFYD